MTMAMTMIISRQFLMPRVRLLVVGPHDIGYNRFFKRPVLSAEPQLTRFFSATETAAQSPRFPSFQRSATFVIDKDLIALQRSIRATSHRSFSVVFASHFYESVALGQSGHDVDRHFCRYDVSVSAKELFQIVFSDLWAESSNEQGSFRLRLYSTRRFVMRLHRPADSFIVRLRVGTIDATCF